jgi:predicted DsbA family dithiol-disulfide isomerase
MKIEVWSDIACPFCYIGKRNLEKALSQYEKSEQVEIVWKSFELDPRAPKEYQRDIYSILAAKYQKTADEVRQMTQSVISMAQKSGLKFNFEQLKPVNTFDAHRLIHLAAQENKADMAKEALLKAYFVEGKIVSHIETLVSIGQEIGLDPENVRNMLISKELTEEVLQDEQESRLFGVSGVPYFLINRKYQISGAQPAELFLQALQQIGAEETRDQMLSGKTCDVDGNC